MLEKVIFLLNLWIQLINLLIFLISLLINISCALFKKISGWSKHHKCIIIFILGTMFCNGTCAKFMISWIYCMYELVWMLLIYISVCSMHSTNPSWIDSKMCSQSIQTSYEMEKSSMSGVPKVCNYSPNYNLYRKWKGTLQVIHQDQL